MPSAIGGRGGVEQILAFVSRVLKVCIPLSLNSYVGGLVFLARVGCLRGMIGEIVGRIL